MAPRGCPQHIQLLEAQEDKLSLVLEGVGTRLGEVAAALGGIEETRRATEVSAVRALRRLDRHFRQIALHSRELHDQTQGVRKSACQPIADATAVGRVLGVVGSCAVKERGVGVDGAAVHHVRLALVASSRGGRRCTLEFVVQGESPVLMSLEAWKRACRVYIETKCDRWKLRSQVPPRPLAPLNIARSGHGAAVVSRAKDVLVVGGTGHNNERLASVERFVHGSNAWEACPELSVARRHCGVCAVGNAVVVAGGTDQDFDSLDLVEAVDTAHGNRTLLPALPTKLFGCGAVGLQGQVVVVGGHDGGSFVDMVWALDVRTIANPRHHHHQQQQQQQQPHEWTAWPSMAEARCYHGVATDGGRVFVCGGSNGSDLASCEVLVQTGDGHRAWKPLPPMPAPLSHAGCCFGGGNVFVAGGGPVAQSSVFALGVEEGKWMLVAGLATGRRGCAVVCVGRRVLVLGGHNIHHGGFLASCEVLEF